MILGGNNSHLFRQYNKPLSSHDIRSSVLQVKHRLVKPKQNSLVLSNTKPSLKQYLVFSNGNEKKNSSSNVISIELKDRYRINSDSMTKGVNNSNKRLIETTMKFLYYPPSSLDHYRYSLDALKRSNSMFFSLLLDKASCGLFVNY
jgi:hypothetical protein